MPKHTNKVAAGGNGKRRKKKRQVAAGGFGKKRSRSRTA